MSYKGLYESHCNHPHSDSRNQALNLNESDAGEIEPVKREGDSGKSMDGGWLLQKKRVTGES